MIAILSLADAVRHQRSYDQEPARKFAPVESQLHSIYASKPAVSRSGIVFESIGAEGYILNRALAFEGHAFHPAVPASGVPIYFEMVAKGHSTIQSFDFQTRDLRAVALDAMNPTVSPDGRRLAYLRAGQLIVHGENNLSTPGPVDTTRRGFRMEVIWHFRRWAPFMIREIWSAWLQMFRAS